MATSKVVQLCHPGGEHGWDRAFTGVTGWKEWNRGDHKRKFLLTDGSYTWNPKQPPKSGSFTFWGEWEPQSEVRRLPSSGTRHPRWLHTPRLRLNEIASLNRADFQTGSCTAGGPQNTDPLVFGDRFRYVLCRQFQNKSGLPTELAHLGQGDIVLFGSNIDESFALDTVLVVGLSSPVSKGRALPDWESELHRRVTMDLFETPRRDLRLYGGERWSANVPFSFVPCLPVDQEARGFPRPIIKPSGLLFDVISPKSKQNFKVRTFNESQSARSVWDAIVQQVLDRGCALGTNVEEPADVLLEFNKVSAAKIPRSAVSACG